MAQIFEINAEYEEEVLPWQKSEAGQWAFNSPKTPPHPVQKGKIMSHEYSWYAN